MKNTKILAEIEIGKTFEVAGIEFIKFADVDGCTQAVSKDILFKSDFGENNNFAESTILEKLRNNVLPKIEEAVGAENVVEFETNLLSLDGSDEYGNIKSKISLPTFDFYRANVKIFDKHKLDKWWWLATPDSTTEHANDYWVVCVSPSGDIYGTNYNYDDNGVRPFLNFVSSISVSCEE